MTNILRSRTTDFILTAVLAFASSQMAIAYPGKSFQLEQLVNESDVVAVVELSNIQNLGTTNEHIDGNSITSESHKADMRVLRRLKGLSPERAIVTFTTPGVFVGYPGVGPGVQIAFLKCQEDRCTFADRHFPTLPALSEIAAPIVPITNPVERVTAELGAVISSKSAPPSDKWKVLAKAYGIPKIASFTSALRLGLQNANDNDSDLKCRIEAALISRDDLSQLTVVKDSLLAGQLTHEQKELFLSVIANEVKDPEAAPALGSLLHSEDTATRRAAAEALWHSASASATPDLVRALQDQDEQVRFYAVRGLADINAQSNWGPSSEEFRENQQQYLSHWQEWAASQHH
jgi:hypothetical protein